MRIWIYCWQVPAIQPKITRQQQLLMSEEILINEKKNKTQKMVWKKSFATRSGHALTRHR